MGAIFQKIVAIVTLPFVLISGLFFTPKTETVQWEEQPQTIVQLQKEREQRELSRIQLEIEAIRKQIEILKKEQPELFKLGASLDIPTPVALFETTLASSISTSATTMTLTSATDKDGTVLASSTYGFIIDEGTASEEMVLADCTSTACTNMIRGISVLTGTSTVAALQKAHRRGASVKITDGPILLILKRIVNGEGLFPRTLRYKSTASACSNVDDICDKAYIDNSVNQGAATSTQTNGGIVELATATEAASSTDLGANQPLVLQAKNATSTPSGYASSTNVVVTENDGTLNPFFLSGSKNNIWRGGQTFASTTGVFEIQSGTTTLTNANAKLGIGTSSPSVSLTVASSTAIFGGLGVGKATTTSGAIETTGMLGVGGTTTTNGLAILGGNQCVGCVKATTTRTTTAFDTTQGNLTQAIATCPTGSIVVGGGWSGIPEDVSAADLSYSPVADGPVVSSVGAISTTQWLVRMVALRATNTAGTLMAYAICVSN